LARRRARWATALAGSVAVSICARRANLLTRDGAAAASLAGAAVLAGTGIRGGAGLMLFFATSSLLGKLPNTNQTAQRRGNQRDAVQVLANGGIPAALSLASLQGSPQRRQLLLASFAGALATATADTWATEVGSRCGRKPRRIIGLQPVPRGTSGGVTLAGLTGSLAGASLIGTVLDLRVSREPPPTRSAAFAIALAGFAGALADSIIGATLQEVRTCDTCQVETELFRHHCGSPTRRVHGQAWCNNDVVNALAIAIGAVSAALLVSKTLKSGSDCNQR
jgi:uncharacterized protein (TIGR00297 family)